RSGSRFTAAAASPSSTQKVSDVNIRCRNLFPGEMREIFAAIVRPGKLARRGLHQPARSDDAHVPRRAVEFLCDTIAYLEGDLPVLGAVICRRLGDDDELLRAARLIGDPERDHPSGRHAFDLAGRRFDITRIEIPPLDDDEVLGTSCNVELS